MAVSITSRTRSFGGCGRCRARHMKCDEQRPECSNCIAYNLQCDGCLRNIFFDTKETEDGTVRYRQVLFTDDERKQMNQLMTREVPLWKTNEAVAAVETACETDSTRIAFQRGPFGVFRLAQDVPRSPSRSLTILPRGIPSPPIMHDDLPSFHVPEWIETSSMFDFEAFNLSPPPISDNIMRDPSPAVSDTFDQWLISNDEEALPVLSLDQAPLLLKHYADNVVTSFTPFRHAKTPWHILFLPNAKTTLASLAMGECVDNADLTIFYGIMAVSALDLNAASSGGRWQVEASSLERKAQQCFAEVLLHALYQPKAFKYKSVVMAILVMVQIAMINGSWEQMDACLLEAERVIRLRGLTKRNKSRKVRLLHHCYAYTRVFHESISLVTTESPHRSVVKNAIEQSGVVIPCQDPLSFRLTAWEDLEQKSSETKSRDEGENDLHLGTPGLWSATLYPEIFGVSESWLVLLSQVIRLANEKDLAGSIGEDSMPLQDYLKRAKGLERCILHWESSVSNASSSSTPSALIVDTDWITLESLLGALKHALAIYYYRRILDVDAELLQAKVVKVKDSLFAVKRLCLSSGKYLNGLMWSAFIAGCEAQGDQLQESFSDWFHLCTQLKGHASCNRMHSIMKEVWQERRRDQRNTVSWIRLLRNQTH